MVSVKAKLASGAIWVAGARLIVNLLAIASTLLLARLLMPADFGLVALAWIVIAVLNAVSEVSAGALLVQHPNPTRDHLDTAWTLSALRGLFIALALVSLSYPMALAFSEPRLPPVLQSLALATLFIGLKSPRQFMLVRDLVFWQQAVLEVGQKLVGLIVSVAIAIVYQSYWALVAGTIATELTGLAISYLLAPHLPRFKLFGWREMFNYSIWLALSQLINTINWRFDHLLIGTFLGKTPLGFYTVGDNLAALPTREAIAPLTSTLFPAFSRVKNNNRTELAAAYQSAQSLVTMVALPLGVGMALIAKPLVLLTLTDKWLPAVVVIQALSAVFALHTLGSLAHPLAMATGDTRLLFKRDLQAFLLRAPSVAVGMALGGLVGVAIARAASGIIGIAFNLQVVTQVLGLSWLEQLGPNIRTMVSAAAMAIAVLIVQSTLPSNTDAISLTLELGLLIATGAAVFAGTQLLLWVWTGKPTGPELELAGIVQRLFRALRPRLSRRAMSR